ncbi:MAG: hypothetical protein PHY62_07550 [Gallionella sp.]|nr:hypothetical protein [Gallionella sp.]
MSIWLGKTPKNLHEMLLNSLVEGFSKRYGVHSLVYFELGENMLAAIAREKQIKAGSRKKKLQLIEEKNPDWRDLFDEIV